MSMMDNKTLKVGFDLNTQPANANLNEVKNAVLLVERAIQNTAMHLSRVINNQTAEMKMMMESVKTSSTQATQSQESLSKAMIATTVAMKGLSMGVSLMKDFSAASQEAWKYNEQITSDLIKRMQVERELQALQGRKSTAETAIETLRFAMNAGMSAEDATKFKTEFQNSGAQFVGKTVTQQQSEQFQKQAAQFAAVKGIEADVVGDLAGKLTGQHDFSKEGAAGSKELFKRMAQSMSILSAGSGGNSQLVNQQARIMASLMSEDETAGVFKTPQEVATLVSTFAEASPKETETYSKAAVRGLRDFKGKPAALLTQAGITPQTNFMDAVNNIAPIIDKIAKETGEKRYDVLGRYFEDQETKTALSVLLNKGVGPNGAFAARAQTAKDTEPDKVLAEMNDALNDMKGPLAATSAATGKQLAEAERAKGRIGYQNFAQQAENSLIAKGELNTSYDNFGEKFFDNVNFLNGLRGKKGARAEHIDIEAVNLLESANRQAGNVVPASEFETARANAGYEANEARIMRIMDLLEKAGVTLNAAAEKAKAEGGKTMTKATPGGGKAVVAR
jgi:dihydroxyacetone kinase DhaKLM complex PTS-EIIA-like component DhaM